MMRPEALALLREAEREQLLAEAYLQALDLLLAEMESELPRSRRPGSAENAA